MKKKVVILYNKLFHYRIPIFNLLAQKYDLTVVYSYPANEDDIAQCQFKTVYVPIKQVGNLFFHKQSISMPVFVIKTHTAVLGSIWKTLMNSSV